MKKVRAKFIVDSIQTDGSGDKTLNMSAVTSEAGDGQDFTEYTPWGNLQIGISGDVPASDFFKEGGIYYMDFSKVEN